MAAAAARNKIMVLNAGSSSLKFKLFEMGAGGGAGAGAATALKAVASGVCERIGDPAASFLRVGFCFSWMEWLWLEAVARGRAGGRAGAAWRREASTARRRSPPQPLPTRPRQAKAGGGGEAKVEAALPDHTKALELVSSFLGDAFKGVRRRRGCVV